MKRIILSLVLGLTIVSCNSKADHNNNVEFKKQALVACKNAAITPGMSIDQQELIKKYCECSTDKMLVEFTYEEMLQMDKPSKELQDRLLKVIEPCMDELKNKSVK